MANQDNVSVCTNHIISFPVPVRIPMMLPRRKVTFVKSITKGKSLYLAGLFNICTLALPLKWLAVGVLQPRELQHCCAPSAVVPEDISLAVKHMQLVLKVISLAVQLMHLKLSRFNTAACNLRLVLQVPVYMLYKVKSTRRYLFAKHPYTLQEFCLQPGLNHSDTHL